VNCPSYFCWRPASSAVTASATSTVLAPLVLDTVTVTAGAAGAMLLRWELVASGEARAALALFEDSPEIDLSTIAAKAISSNGGLLLNAKKQLVGDALAADQDDLSRHEPAAARVEQASGAAVETATRSRVLLAGFGGSRLIDQHGAAHPGQQFRRRI